MNGTINGGMNGTVQRTQDVPLWLRDHVNLFLLGLITLTLVSLFYFVGSWVIFEIRTRPLLARANPVGKPAQLNESPGENPGQNPARADKAENPPDPEEAKRKERFAQLEQRALFGEPKPAVQRPRIEAILGNSALINGQWLSAGGKTDDYTVVSVEVGKVTMADREGRRHDFALEFGENDEGPAGSDSQKRETAKTATDAARSFDVPDAILDAIKRYAPDATLKKIKWDSKRGHYAVETSTSDGRDIDMKIGADGSLRVKDEEVRLADLPQAVHGVVQGKLAEGGTLSDLKRWTRDGTISYEAEIKTGSQKTTLNLAEDGTLLEKN